MIKLKPLQRITVSITQTDILKAKDNYGISYLCPIARAINRTLHTRNCRVSTCYVHKMNSIGVTVLQLKPLDDEYDVKHNILMNQFDTESKVEPTTIIYRVTGVKK